ncbi:hypothetical protein HFU97_11060, partial [Acidithiobacillus sp. BN09-2]|nr:hypothetical protein [Acidithiobacillus sp. BN09-2]
MPRSALHQKTTGEGKTRTIASGLDASSAASDISTPLVTDAIAYEDAGSNTTRRRPRVKEQGGEHHCAAMSGEISTSRGIIPIKAVAPDGRSLPEALPDYEHRASAGCRTTCPIGLEIALKNNMSESSTLTPYQRWEIENALNRAYPEEWQREELKNAPCFIKSEIPRALHALHTVTTAKGFSSTDARYNSMDGSVPRWLVADEFDADMLMEHRTLSALDIAELQQNMIEHIIRLDEEEKNLRKDSSVRRADRNAKFAAFREQRLPQIYRETIAAQESHRITDLIRDHIADTAVTGAAPHTVPDDIRDAVLAYAAEFGDVLRMATAPWERPEWEIGQGANTLPMRAFGAIARGIINQRIVVDTKGLHVSFRRPMLDIIDRGSHPIDVFDATPHPTIARIAKIKDWDITADPSRQNMTMDIDPRFVASMPARQHQTDEWMLSQGRMILEILQQLKQPHRPIVGIANRPRVLGFYAALTGKTIEEVDKILTDNNGEFPGMEEAPIKMTYWGRGQRAHNRFAGHDLVQFDSPSMPREAQQEAWLKHRATLIELGEDPDSLPVGSFTDADYISGHKTKVGNYMHLHLARVHRDPQIREFLQSIIDNEEIQWIGRA